MILSTVAPVMLCCAFGFCVIECHLYCVYISFAIKKVGVEEEEEEEGVKK